MEFISKKYKCGITIGSDENPRGDEDIIGLSGNSIGIKQVVYEILKKIEFGTLKANDDSIIEAEGKLKTYKRKTKKSKENQIQRILKIQKSIQLISQIREMILKMIQWW